MKHNSIKPTGKSSVNTINRLEISRQLDLTPPGTTKNSEVVSQKQLTSENGQTLDLPIVLAKNSISCTFKSSLVEQSIEIKIKKAIRKALASNDSP